MSEQGEFENEWRNAFEGAEITPPAGVWSNVKAEVASELAQKQSKRVVYWRWMAAASVTLLLGASMTGFYFYQAMLEDYQQLAQQEQVLLQEITLMEEEECEEEASKAMIAQQEMLALSTKSASEIVINEDSEITVDTNEESTTFNKTTQMAMANESENNSSSDNADKIYSPIKQDKEKNLNESYGIASNDVIKPIDETEEKAVWNDLDAIKISRLVGLESGLNAQISDNIEPQKVPDMLEIIKMQNGEKNNFRGMWAGLSVGGGSYQSNINRGANNNSFELANQMIEGITSDGQDVLLNAGDVNQTNVETPAFSYAISADFGKQIGRRTYLQGGVEYSRYSLGATSNVAISDVNSDEQAFLRFENSAALDRGALTTTDSYELANNFEYVAIPLKFGYQLLDKKIGISLSTGVSTNFFLKNTLMDKSGTRNDVEVTNGVSSPYKPLNFNGLLGAEISYQWNELYQLAIVPDYRISLDGVTKTDAFIQSKPSALFIGFRFKYILK